MRKFCFLLLSAFFHFLVLNIKLGIIEKEEHPQEVEISLAKFEAISVKRGKKTAKKTLNSLKHSKSVPRNQSKKQKSTMNKKRSLRSASAFKKTSVVKKSKNEKTPARKLSDSENKTKAEHSFALKDRQEKSKVVSSKTFPSKVTKEKTPSKTVDVDFLKSLIISALEKCKKYPPSARRLGIEGEVLLKIEIYKSGKLKSASVLRTSGSKILDNSALKLAKNCPFPPLPEDYENDTFSTKVLIVYKLTER